jgi:hypothetical protein
VIETLDPFSGKREPREDHDWQHERIARRHRQEQHRQSSSGHGDDDRDGVELDDALLKPPQRQQRQRVRLG